MTVGRTSSAPLILPSLEKTAKRYRVPSFFNPGSLSPVQFNVPLPQANGGANPTRPPKVYKVKITLAATINPELLNRFVHGQQSHDDEATTAITVRLR